jgi:hypothetical protein
MVHPNTGEFTGSYGGVLPTQHDAWCMVLTCAKNVVVIEEFEYNRFL